MKLMWFHLMPYTELPEDFNKKHPSVWVDIHSSLFDPKRAHHMYNDFMDELEYAAELGYDAICVNEHHSNGYGLMPSPNLIASSLARRTTDTALCVMGNSLALYNPPTRVAEEFAMIDCISGGRLIAGFPVGSPMDTCYAYGQNPSLLRERYLEAHDLVKTGLDREGHLRLQRPLQPAALRQHLAAADPGRPASADLDPRRRLGRDVAVVRGDGLRLLLPLLLRLQGRARDDAGLLERDGQARQGPQSVPRRLPAVRRRRRKPPAGARPLHRAGRVLLRPLPACRSRASRRRRATSTEATQRVGHPGHDAEGGQRRQSRDQGRAEGHQHEGHRRWRLRPHRLARRSGRADPPRRHQPECRPSHAAAAVRQHEQGHDQVQHAAVRREGDAEGEGPVRRMGRQVVAEADGQGASAPPSRPSARRPSPRSSRVSAACRPPPSTSTAIPAASGPRARARSSASWPGLGGLPRWLPFLDRLAETRHGDRAVAAGLSRRDRATPSSTRISTGCWRCARSIDKAGLAGADLVGASVGGAFAAEMAAIFPGHVRQLVADRAVRPVRRRRNPPPIPGRSARTCCPA